MADEDDDFADVMLVNQSGVPDEEVLEALRHSPEVAKVRSWVKSFSGSTRSAKASVLQQDRYVSPDNIFDQFRVAADAAESDDVVSNAVETTEQLAFKRVELECGEEDETNIANQIIDEIELPQRMREIWKELFTISQCYCAIMWERKDFKVKGVSPTGKKKKKVYKNLLIPRGITILDPCKVIPVGTFMFGQEDLVYIADIPEAKSIFETLANKNTSDLVVNALYERPYTPDQEEMQELTNITGQYNLENRLFLLKKENCWRITHSRPSYQRFASVRMKSVFEQLDLKNNLMEADRADILGNLNCIILVKKGDDKRPANDDELAQAAFQMQQSAKIPLIVTDHRLEIEIITRDMSEVLNQERYDVVNGAIASRLYQILHAGAHSTGKSDDSGKLFKVVASSMETRRDQIRDSIMEKVIDVIWEKNSDKLTGAPEMIFFPRRVALDFDPLFAQFIFDLFVRGDISRETTLAEFDMSQAQEAVRREREDALYEKIFVQKVVPGAPAPTTGDPKADGRAGGGSKNGGGLNQTSFQSSPSDQPKNINKS